MAEPWAPLAIFVFNRPEHTRRMIASLKACEGFAKSPVHVFADGPRHIDDLPAIRQARVEARRLLGDTATYLEQDKNVGLEDSLIGAVTELCNEYGRVVVLEDDLVLSPMFLKFINAGLRQYEDEPRVMQVCGYMYDVPQFRRRNQAIFLPTTSSWGWGTWKRAWDRFDPEATGWRERLGDARERRRFDIDGHFAYAKMLSDHMRGSDPAWDIRWYYSVFASGGLALFPPRTLVLHTGFDGTGMHDRFSLPVHQAELEMTATFEMPGVVVEATDKGLVFEATERFRPSSVARKTIALARFMVRRARRMRWPTKKRTAAADSAERDETPTGEAR